MVGLIVFGLLCAAVLYGVFFLIFKLIWLLFGNKRNLWPLILAGAATAGVAVMTFIAAHNAYTRFIRPVTPIIEAAQTRTAPVYGQQTYTDPRYGFTLTLYNGTVTGDWMDFSPVSVLLAFDVNGLTVKNSQDFAGFAVAREVKDKNADAHQIMAELVPQLRQARSARGELTVLAEPAAADAGAGATASFLPVMLRTEGTEQGIPAFLLIAARGHEVYYLIGLGNTSDNEVVKTLQSFRFPAL